jgi:hypothetical protein
MNRFLKTSAIIICFTLMGFTQIDNVQFKDMDGNSYDLYELLAEGKHVYVMMSFNG